MAGIKRNIQEMYNGNSNANSNTNGHNHSSLIHSNETTNVNDAKKTRLDNNKQAEASRVVHLRNIPTQLTENEIIYLGLAFGPIKNVLFLRSKSQAFLEFERLDDSQQMCTHFQTTQATFSGKKIFVQFSNHAELNTDPSNSNNLMAQTALAEAGSLHKASRVGGKNTVLRATILNMIYPVTLDVLQQIFSKFGPVLKCITFNKNDKFQVLIQMFTSQAAQNARQALNNQNIYNGCCTLQIEFSKLITLEVRFNNDKSRDYTNMLLPTGNDGQQIGVNEQQGGVGGGGNQFGHFNNQSIIGNPPNMQTNGMHHQSPQYHHHQQQQQQQQQHHHHQHQSHFNPQMNGMGGGHHQMMNQGGGGGGMMQMQQHGMSMSSQMGLPQPMMNNPNMNNPNGVTNSPVILVSNLNEDLVTPEALFTLFGVYGDVMRVKILFNKKDSALINFSNGQQAATAQSMLDRCKLWNKQIRVFPSKHVTVQMPKDGTPDSGLTKDFSTSPLHRFKKPGSKNFNNIFPPSPTLHLSNIPASVSEQEIRDLFSTYGTVKAFKFFQKDRKMALVQMDTAEEACTALIATHNYQLAENMHLRCTFSKATI